MGVDYAARHEFRERCQERRKAGEPGWANQKSYETKAAIIEEILARYPIPVGGRFLELGCGAGNVTLLMAERGFEAHGIDIVPEAISWARERMAESCVRAHLRVGNVVDLRGYPDDFFDFVFDGDCLHCIIGADRRTCLANVLRALKPGGLFHAVALCLNPKQTNRYDVCPGIYFDPESQCVFRHDVPYDYLSREEDFLREIRDAGLRIIHRERVPPKPGDDPFTDGELFVDAVKP